ncbi:hypothetical protein KV557_34340 [Kitasatospora aureofaciens]|uniref:YciI family protein n=1 Tax=Kitasatospora aureofaciens TaxID=1894 RepID=UPI001C47E6DB|nr:YciI family protein [Kitasatospora aureofaciens]MBV6702128.1 hypothetical protein [Kitasatospora aureofaciens]
MFILTLTYLADLADLAEIDAVLPAHRDYLERHYRTGRFLLSGRRVPRTGGVILALGDDPEEIRAITATDPFVVAGLARYDIVQATPTAVSATLADALGAAGVHDVASMPVDSAAADGVPAGN